MYRLYYASTKPARPPDAGKKSFTGSLGDLLAWAKRKVREDKIWDDWGIYNEAAGHLVCAGRLDYNPRVMKTSPFSTAHLAALAPDVSAMVAGARQSGPVLLLDEDGKPCGVVFGFEDAEDAEDWVLEHSPEAQAAFAEGAADKAAGRVTPHAEVVREILGA